MSSRSTSATGAYGQTYSGQRYGTAATGTASDGAYPAYGPTAARAYPYAAVYDPQFSSTSAAYSTEPYAPTGYGAQQSAPPPNTAQPFEPSAYGLPLPLVDRAAYLRQRLLDY